MNYLNEMNYEAGAVLGDPRRCRRHPWEVTSSPDGMHDAPCGACEYECETGKQVTQKPTYCGFDGENLATTTLDGTPACAGCVADSDIPF